MLLCDDVIIKLILVITETKNFHNPATPIFRLPLATITAGCSAFWLGTIPCSSNRKSHWSSVKIKPW